MSFSPEPTSFLFSLTYTFATGIILFLDQLTSKPLFKMMNAVDIFDRGHNNASIHLSLAPDVSGRRLGLTATYDRTIPR